jgi:glycosyltransferase involved in cell wall biosynthesis
MISVLYDGWPLIYEPESLTSLHLWTLLAYIPPQVEPIVALPAPAPPWLSEITTHIYHTPNNSWSRMVWQQKTLPELIRRLNIQILHLTSKNVPFFKADISVVSPAAYDFTPLNSLNSFLNREPVIRNLPAKRGRLFIDRIREALSMGGLARAHTIFWPEDIPEPDSFSPITPLPPVIHPDFLHKTPELPIFGMTGTTINLPEDYILYHGPYDTRSIYRLLQTWSWAAGSIGEQYPLLLIGVDRRIHKQIESILAKTDFGDTIRLAADVSPPAIPFIYQNCSALFHLAEVSPWDGPLRYAMVSGIPIVSVDNPLVKAIIGPAGYLVQLDDDRNLGAAIISLIVDQELSLGLAKAAKDRSTEWFKKDFSKSLLTAYQELVGYS